MVSIHAEGIFGRLRYSLGGDRPSQTARLTLSRGPLPPVRTSMHEGWYPNSGSPYAGAHGSQPPTYPVHHASKPNVNLQ